MITKNDHVKKSGHKVVESKDSLKQKNRLKESEVLSIFDQNIRDELFGYYSVGEYPI